MPGRGHRPLGNHADAGQKIDPAEHDAHCAFCAGRLLETPPEKARLIRAGDRWETLKNLPAEQLFETVAEFRRVPNLFEIVSWDYWQRNFGYTLPEPLAARKLAYVATEAGRRHVLDVIESRMRLSGLGAAEVAEMAVEDKLAAASAFFGGGHELVISRRHFVDQAEYDSQLCSSGALSRRRALPVLPLHHRRGARHLSRQPLRPLRRRLPELAAAGRRLVRPPAQAARRHRRPRRLQRDGNPSRAREPQHLQRGGGELRRATATWSSPRTTAPSPSPASATASRRWRSIRRRRAASRGITPRRSSARSPTWCTPATRRWARPSPATRNGTTSRPTPTSRCPGVS